MSAPHAVKLLNALQTFWDIEEYAMVIMMVHFPAQFVIKNSVGPLISKDTLSLTTLRRSMSVENVEPNLIGLKTWKGICKLIQEKNRSNAQSAKKNLVSKKI